MAFAQVGATQLELVEPIEGTSICSELLESHGPGLHPIQISVPDFAATVAALESAGIENVCSGTGFHVGSVRAYFDTSLLLDGLVMEICKRPDETRDEGRWATSGEEIGHGAS